MEVCDYRRVNESFRKRLVYHAGIDCGFFVELNYMVNAMLHCCAFVGTITSGPSVFLLKVRADDP